MPDRGGSHPPPEDPDSSAALDRLRKAWMSAPPAPALADLLDSRLIADSKRLVPLVRFDALERRRRGISSSFEHYRALLGPAADPESPVAEFLLGIELILDRIDPADLKQRLPEAYHPQIERLAAKRERLATEITAAVAGHDAMTADLRSAAAQDLGGLPPVTSRWEKGDRIGTFTLRTRLGAGAFGEVWLARREAPELDVAIKVLKPGATDSEAIKRFAVEAQVLAFMQHRYVARIHDAGTVNGLPYIAMEFVDGKPLTRYCDDRRLSLEQRLELMARICEGVQHAHQRGLIHRDLKPDNVLITEERRHPKDVDAADERLVVERSDTSVTLAVPKIVDFGLAKAIDRTVRLPDGTLTVDLGKLMGTPEYMAPEQAGHNPLEVTQRADIFSLGVILYELLAGTLPLTKEEIRERAREELVAMLRETPRPDPSTKLSRLGDDQLRALSYQRGELSPQQLDAALRGRLRHLCGKALRLEPEKRFSSPAALATDIRNYLDDLDFIEAAAEPWSDRARRHVRRHQLPYAATAAALIALTAGVAGTTWGWRKAVAANRGLAVTSAELLKLSDRLFENLRARENIRSADIERLEEATNALRMSLQPTDRNLLALENLLAGVYKWMGRFDDADRRYGEIDVMLARSLPPSDSRRLQNGFNRAIVYTSRGAVLVNEARSLPPEEADAVLAEADRAFEEALQRLRALRSTAAASHPISNERLLEIDSEIALVLTRLRRYEEALPAYRSAIDAMESALPSDHWRIADTVGGYGTALLHLDRSEDAAKAFERSFEIYSRNSERGPAHGFTLAVAGRWAVALARTNRCNDAWTVIARACKGFRESAVPAEPAGLDELRRKIADVRAACGLPPEGTEIPSRLFD